MRVAISQSSGKLQDVAANLDTMRRMTAAAAELGAQLVIFPELFLTGYDIGDAAFELAEPVDGESAKRVSTMARENRVAILYGYPEHADGDTFNAALLIDRNGTSLGNYRKAHLWGEFEKRVFHPGSRHCHVDLDGLKIGILICYDVEFPELVRAYAISGVDLVAVPTALMKPYDIVTRALVPTRAFENRVYLAYANRCGSEHEVHYCGQSCIVAPDGRDLARAGELEEMIVADVDPDLRTSFRK